MTSVSDAEVADAEDLAGDLAEADAEGDAVLVGGVDDELGAVEALGDDDGADRLGVEVGRLGAELEAPGVDGAADALGEPVVAGEDVLEPLLLEHLQRLAEAVEQVDRRGVGEAALGVGGQHVAEVEEAARQLRGLHRLRAPSG